MQKRQYVETPEEDSIYYRSIHGKIKEAAPNKWVLIKDPQVGNTWIYKDPEHYILATVAPNVTHFGVVKEWNCMVSRIYSSDIKMQGFEATSSDQEELKSYCEEAINKLKDIA